MLTMFKAARGAHHLHLLVQHLQHVLQLGGGRSLEADGVDGGDVQHVVCPAVKHHLHPTHMQSRRAHAGAPDSKHGTSQSSLQGVAESRQLLPASETTS